MPAFRVNLTLEHGKARKRLRMFFGLILIDLFFFVNTRVIEFRLLCLFRKKTGFHAKE